MRQLSLRAAGWRRERPLLAVQSGRVRRDRCARRLVPAPACTSGIAVIEHLPHSTAEDQYRTSRTSSVAPSTFAARSTACSTTNAWLQEIGSELFTSVQNGVERHGYSADSLFVRRIAAVVLGIPSAARRRGGAGLSLSMTASELRRSSATVSPTAQVCGHCWRSAEQRAQPHTVLRAGWGSVRCVAPSLRCGRQDSGIRFHRAGTIARRRGRWWSDLSGCVVVRRECPLRAAPSLGVVGLRWRSLPGEGKQKSTFAPTPQLRRYSLMATDGPTRIYGDDGSGVATAATRPFDGRHRRRTKSVARPSVDIGPIRDRNLRLHAGFATGRLLGVTHQVFSGVDPPPSWRSRASATRRQNSSSLSCLPIFATGAPADAPVDVPGRRSPSQTGRCRRR